MLCPSDDQRDFLITWPTNGYQLTFPRGNYVASWGNTVLSQQDTAGGTPTQNLPVTYRRSAFGNRSVRLANVTDGTSSTIFTGEQRQGTLNDARGAVWTLAGIFTTRFTPNGIRDFYGVADLPGSSGDRLGDAFCVSEPGSGLPCVNSVAFPYLNYYSGSRSRHPGGVNASFGDGSVRFIKNTVDPSIWVGLNSISGGEVISSVAY